MVDFTSKRMPRVLVLLASYNGQSWIGEQLDSISRQKGVAIDILISDDGSQDSTLKIIQQRRLAGCNISILPFIKKSGSAGNNFQKLFCEARLGEYDYVAFSDQDDIWNENKIYNAVKTIREKDCNGYSSSVNAFWPNGKAKTLIQSDNVRRFDFLFEGGGQGCSFVLDARAFKRIQNFVSDNLDITNQFYFHDWLVYLLVRSWGLGWYFDRRPSMEYRQHDVNVLGARSGIKSFMGRLHLIRSGWYKNQILLASQLADIAGLNDPLKIHFNKLIRMNNSFCRSICLTLFCLKHGRRKVSDRAVLVAAALFGFV